MPSLQQTQIRYKDKVLPSYTLQYNDLSSLVVLKNEVLETLKGAGIFWETVYLKYRPAAAKQREDWITLTRNNFRMVEDAGKIYASDVDDVPKDVSLDDLTTDDYCAKLVKQITSSIVSITDDVMEKYETHGFKNEGHKELFVILDRLMMTGAVVILDEAQSAKHVLEVAISVKEPWVSPSKGKFLVLGTPRLGASRHVDLDPNNENKIQTLLDVPPMTVVEMITYSQGQLKRQLSAEEIAYLYAFSGGHIRVLRNMLTSPENITNDSKRIQELQIAKKELKKSYTIEEQQFLLQCARKNQQGNTAPQETDIANLLQSQDIVYAVSSLEKNGHRYKLKDPLLKSIMNDEARTATSKVNVRGLIGNVVEGLVDELLEALASNRIPINGINLEGYVPSSVSMPKLDVDTVLTDEENKNLLVFNTKFSNTQFNEKIIAGFQKNVDLLRKTFPEAKVTTIHFAMVVDDKGCEPIIRKLVGQRNELYWILDDLLAVITPLINRVEISIMEDDIWIRRPNEEKSLRQWMNAKNNLSISTRISGHAGNGKTALAKHIGMEVSKKGGRKVIYVDLLRRTGRIL